MSTGTASTPRIQPGTAAQKLAAADSNRRLALLALFYTLAYTISMGLGITFEGSWSVELLQSFQFIVALVSVGCALVIFFIARFRIVTGDALTWLALAWLVPATWGILAGEGWARLLHFPEQIVAAQALGISWACVFVTLYPFVVPIRVSQVVLGTFLAACAAPAHLLLYGWAMDVPVAGKLVFGLSVPLFICAGLSILPAVFLSRTREQMERARLLGSYRLEEKLGQGGMGEVWRARHQMLVRPAAIKLIQPEAGGGSPGIGDTTSPMLRRFEREVQATASLRSPHTISVYDFGITDEGAFYYVMELLDGLDVRTLVERFGPVPEDRAIHMLGQVCHSLEEAHHHDLIHRDIKPANIFACRQGLDCDVVKVLDFGLVRTVEDAKPKETRLTAEGVATGTPSTMAPEAALSSPEMDGRLDLYSLGCVAYWLVTGSEVFPADTPMAMVLKHVREEPVPPSRRTEMEISPAFEAVIMACLKKEPAERPGSAGELRAMLEACPGSGAWDRARARAWWEKHLP